MLTANHNKFLRGRKFPLEQEKYNATNFLVLWDFEGVFKYSPLFYGWYTTDDESKTRGYKLPIAYFVTGLVVYAYSFFAILRKMAENSRTSKLLEKDDEYTFSWKLFTAWDYMIGNAETALNRSASIVMGFKEALLEEAEKKRESRKWKVVCFRVLVNTIVLGLLTFSAFAVVKVVKRSTTKDANSTVWRKNELTIVMSLITFLFPMMFEVLGLLEQYHPRKQLRLQLARIMVLNLLNLYSLIFALFGNISSMTSRLKTFKNMTNIESCLTDTTNFYSTSTPSYSSLYYYPTNKMKIESLISESFISDLAHNISTVSYPVMRQLLEEFNTQASTELNTPNNTSFDDYTYEDFIENSALVNSTDIIYENLTLSSISFLNETIGNYTELNFSDFKEKFVDYLTYILHYTTNSSRNILENTSEESIFNNMNNINLSETTDSGFEMFKSTVISLLSNVSNKYDNDKVEQELLNIHNKISTTMISLHENMTTNNSTTYKMTTIPYDFANNYTTISPTNELFPPKINYSMCAELRRLCWETMFGQELIKLTVMDLVMTILSTLAVDFFRGIFVRIMNRCWCWDLEKTFPKYGDFKVAENILHLVNNQGMVWMGMFFSPGLVALNVIKLYITMYFRAWAVLTCNVPHAVIFRASRSNNFYYALLLMMLFLCVLPVGYAIVRIKPSWHCGPFSGYHRIFHIFTETIKENVPEYFQAILDYIASPGIVIPLLVLLILIIYYLVSLSGALREANEDLKFQLQRERTEERRKMFQIVDRRRGGSGESNELFNTPFAKWKKLMGSSPYGKSLDETPKQESDDLLQPIKQKNVENKNKDYFTKIIKRALGKSLTKSDEEQNTEDGTDTEQHESLPDDSMSSKQHLHKFVRSTLSWGDSDLPTSVNKRDLKRNLSTNNNSAEMKHVEILDSTLRHATLHNCDNFDQNKNQLNKNTYTEPAVPSTSGYVRQGSSSSVWSDIIPVITISKIESDENMLRKTKSKDEKTEEEKSSHELKHFEGVKFKPKIKCALKKQSTEIDEDTICYFNKNLERTLTENKIIKAVAEEDLEVSALTDEADKFSVVRNQACRKTDNFEHSSSSEGTDFNETSVGTILNFPYTVEERDKDEQNMNNSDTEIVSKSPTENKNKD